MESDPTAPTPDDGLPHYGVDEPRAIPEGGRAWVRAAGSWDR
jgi:hypothetical protein